MSGTEFAVAVDAVTCKLETLMTELRANVDALNAILTAPVIVPEVPGDHATA